MFSGSKFKMSVRAAAYASALAGVLALASCGGGGGCASSAACAPAAAASSTGAVTSAEAVSVAIGNDGMVGVDSVDGIKYGKKFAVTVVDQNGRPVLGADVTPRVELVSFSKGYFERDALTNEIINRYSVTCANEDLNNNDVNDPGEDLNGDGKLTPVRASVAIIAPNGYKTDANGVIIFVLEYYKSDATWVTPRLHATAKVTGTEGSATKDFSAGFADGDEKLPGAPFIRSPYSTSWTMTPSCNLND